ncbi:mechanosensitive ion channel family protein [Alistipes sp.]|uniref:mechanosensitive ion channel family protein n=1 Tax=Alistipes sp. TaxID=1872444 RepID=UPI003AF16029
MLEYEILGNSLQTWLISILFVLGAFVIVKLLSLLGRKVIQPFVTRTRTQVDDIIYYALDSPVKFAVMLLGIWIAIHKLVYPDDLVRYVDKTYRILIVLDITWVLARLSTALLQRYWGHHASGHVQKMMPVVRRTVLVLIWIVGVITALSNVGVDINALWGTLGIGGVALALAAQDTVKNILGAITIFTDKPFGIGDTINVNGMEGTVVDVGLRSTRILGYDRRITSVPNYKITDANIVNITSEPMRRAMVKVGVTYDTSAEKMRQALELLRGLPAQVKDVSDKPSDITAYFSAYADSALEITFYYYIEKQGDILGVTSAMNLAILAAFNGAGLQFAFPTRTVLVQDTKSSGDESSDAPAKSDKSDESDKPAKSDKSQA